MSDSLIGQIHQVVSRSGSLAIVDLPERDRLLSSLASQFVRDDASCWWWATLSGPSEVLPYSDQSQAWAILDDRLRGKGPEIFISVTNDAPGPWLVLRGDLTSLSKLISSLPFFEYFLFDESLNWMLFDTHHNCLVAVGDVARRRDPPSQAL